MLDGGTKYSVQSVYDEETLRRGVRAFVWYRVTRGIGWPGFLALILVVVSFVMMDQMGWVQYLGLAAITLMVLMIVASYFANMHIKLSRFRQMDNPAVTMNLQEDGFEVISSLGQSSLGWNSLKGLLKKPGFWLLFGEKAQFIILPVDGVPQETLNYLDQKVMAKKNVTS